MNRHFFPTFAFFLRIFVSIDMYTAYLYSVIYIYQWQWLKYQVKNSFLGVILLLPLIWSLISWFSGIQLEFEWRWTCRVQSSLTSCSLTWNLFTLIHDSLSIRLMHYTKMAWQFSRTNLKIMIRTFINCFSHRKFVFCLYHWRDRISEMNLTMLVLDEASSVWLSDAPELLKLWNLTKKETYDFGYMW